VLQARHALLEGRKPLFDRATRVLWNFRDHFLKLLDFYYFLLLKLFNFFMLGVFVFLDLVLLKFLVFGVLVLFGFVLLQLFYLGVLMLFGLVFSIFSCLLSLISLNSLFSVFTILSGNNSLTCLTSTSFSIFLAGSEEAPPSAELRRVSDIFRSLL
jgi:hypothetical protein